MCTFMDYFDYEYPNNQGSLTSNIFQWFMYHAYMSNSNFSVLI